MNGTLLVYLFFKVCSIQTGICHTEVMLSPLPMSICRTMQAQVEVIDWLNDHPKYVFGGRMKCESVEIDPGTPI